MKTSKAYSVTLWVILFYVVSAIVAGGAIGSVFYNWESHQDIIVNFYVNDNNVTTSYYSCNSDELCMYQDKGSSASTYDIYYKSRNERNYTVITRQLSFPENRIQTAPYSLADHWWNDVRFWINKSNGANEESVLILSLGESTD